MFKNKCRWIPTGFLASEKRLTNEY